MFGKLFSLPVKILNIPFRTIEKVIGSAEGTGDIPKEDRILSKPLECLSDAIEELDKESD